MNIKSVIVAALSFLAFQRTAQAGQVVNTLQDSDTGQTYYMNVTVTRTISVEVDGMPPSTFQDTVVSTVLNPGGVVDYPEDYDISMYGAGNYALPNGNYVACQEGGHAYVSFAATTDQGSPYYGYPGGDEGPGASGNGRADDYLTSVIQGETLHLSGWAKSPNGNASWYVSSWLDRPGSPGNWEGAGTFAGAATLGIYRADAGGNFGWDLNLDTSSLSVGEHTVEIAASFEQGADPWWIVVTFTVTSPWQARNNRIQFDVNRNPPRPRGGFLFSCVRASSIFSFEIGWLQW
jgi:hypothetical protein